MHDSTRFPKKTKTNSRKERQVKTDKRRRNDGWPHTLTGIKFRFHNSDVVLCEKNKRKKKKKKRKKKIS